MSYFWRLELILISLFPSLSPPFLPLNTSLLCAYHVPALGTLNMRKSRKHTRPSCHYTKEGNIAVIWEYYYERASWAGKVHDPEIYDLDYTGAFEIHLYFISGRHICAFVHVLTTAGHLHAHHHLCSLVPLNFFQPLIECFLFWGLFIQQNTIHQWKWI